MSGQCCTPTCVHIGGKGFSACTVTSAIATFLAVLTTAAFYIPCVGLMPLSVSLSSICLQCAQLAKPKSIRAPGWLAAQRPLGPAQLLVRPRHLSNGRSRCSRRDHRRVLLQGLRRDPEPAGARRRATGDDDGRLADDGDRPSGSQCGADHSACPPTNRAAADRGGAAGRGAPSINPSPQPQPAKFCRRSLTLLNILLSCVAHACGT
jgi:hypothetical protein